MVKIGVSAFVILGIMCVLILPVTIGFRYGSNNADIWAISHGSGGHIQRHRDRYGMGRNHQASRPHYTTVRRVVIVT